MPGSMGCLGVLLQHADERVGVGADELLGRLEVAVLEDHKGGHGCDSELLRYVRQVVHVDLGEEDVLELVFVRVTMFSSQLAELLLIVARQDRMSELGE